MKRMVKVSLFILTSLFVIPVSAMMSRASQRFAAALRAGKAAWTTFQPKQKPPKDSYFDVISRRYWEAVSEAKALENELRQRNTDLLEKLDSARARERSYRNDLYQNFAFDASNAAPYVAIGHSILGLTSDMFPGYPVPSEILRKEALIEQTSPFEN